MSKQSLTNAEALKSFDIHKVVWNLDLRSNPVLFASSIPIDFLPSLLLLGDLFESSLIVFQMESFISFILKFIDKIVDMHKGLVL